MIASLQTEEFTLSPDKKNVEEEAVEETGGHPASTDGGVAPVATVTDTWVTAMPKPDATKRSSMPEALKDAEITPPAGSKEA